MKNTLIALLTASAIAYLVLGLGLRWSGKVAQAVWQVLKKSCKGNFVIMRYSNDLVFCFVN